MTPLERAARAAQEADGAYAYESGNWMKEGGLVTDSHWKDIARAVLEAIREPSEGMKDEAAGRFTVHEHWQEADVVVSADVVWQAMIDVALKEGV